jgi:hypothetical protein
MADWNIELTDGAARSARSSVAPELSPEIVILLAAPPKLGSTLFKKARDVTTSLTPRFVALFGVNHAN